MKIALAQITSTEDLDDNLSTVAKLSAQAASAGARMVVFPEATMCAFGNSLTEPASRWKEWQTALADLADRHDINIVTGEFMPDDDGRILNQAGLYRPGQPRVAYTKIHLFDTPDFSESDAIHPGEDIVVAEVEGVQVGLAICYDIRFPKLFAELSRAGAQIAVVPTSWSSGEDRLRQWRVLTAARALDSHLAIVAVDQARPQASGITPVDPSAPTGSGHSVVTTPFGETSHELGDAPELKVVEVDPGLSGQAAQSLRTLDNARLGY